MGSYSVQIIGSSSVQIRPFPLEISSVVAMQVQFSSTVSRPPGGTTKLCSLHKSRPSNSHRKKLASKTVVAALHDHLYLKRATIAQGFPTFTASQVASQQNLDPSCGVQPEQQSGMMAHGSQSPEELREQLEALQKECKDVWAQANSARARFMRLTDVVEQLRARAAKDVQIGNEASARDLLREKQKVMKALENSKSRAQLLEELSIKLNVAISRKETQLIAALSCARLDLTNEEPDNMNVHVISPKVSVTIDKEASFQEVVDKTEDGKGQQTKSLQEDQPEDLRVNETDMVDDLLGMSPERELRIDGTGGNDHDSCNNNPCANDSKPFVVAPLTLHMRTEDPSPISALQYAATASVSVNDSEYATASQTSIESIPTTTLGNNSNVFTRSGNIKISEEIKTQEVDNVSDLLVESTEEEITKASRVADFNGVPFEAYMGNLNEVLEHVELQLQRYLEVGREQDLIPERNGMVESVRELLELVRIMRSR
ncbi:unnamed protein product [Sphagnum tenellum]